MPLDNGSSGKLLIDKNTKAYKYILPVFDVKFVHKDTLSCYQYS